MVSAVSDGVINGPSGQASAPSGSPNNGESMPPTIDTSYEVSAEKNTSPQEVADGDVFAKKAKKPPPQKSATMATAVSARTHGGPPSPNDGKDARPAVARAIFYSPMQAQGETSSPNKRAHHQSPLKSPIPMAQIMVDDQSVVISTISAHLLTAHQRVQRGHFGPPTHPREKALRLLRQHIVSLPTMMKKLPLKMGNSLPNTYTTINHRCGAVL